ncbi:hypothetical protein [Mangrovihabitans endophyticus]|uniref:Papain fold toxin 1, glutamine deamidase n=1 Tax=Mangrovihabitans endophyticus TaxID=1751298 RepID=A0A8J3BX19_9ACTN|nr:hypothetical protein [Mangrovihabitans endophyticus]GGK78658.1 hypothetical protein GCM10012284_10720 [Mangrovihabitans endophyticus]
MVERRPPVCLDGMVVVRSGRWLSPDPAGVPPGWVVRASAVRGVVQVHFGPGSLGAVAVRDALWREDPGVVARMVEVLEPGQAATISLAEVVARTAVHGLYVDLPRRADLVDAADVRLLPIDGRHRVVSPERASGVRVLPARHRLPGEPSASGGGLLFAPMSGQMRLRAGGVEVGLPAAVVHRRRDLRAAALAAAGTAVVPGASVAASGYAGLLMLLDGVRAGALSSLTVGTAEGGTAEFFVVGARDGVAVVDPSGQPVLLPLRPETIRLTPLTSTVDFTAGSVRALVGEKAAALLAAAPPATDAVPVWCLAVAAAVRDLHFDHQPLHPDPTRPDATATTDDHLTPHPLHSQWGPPRTWPPARDWHDIHTAIAAADRSIAFIAVNRPDAGPATDGGTGHLYIAVNTGDGTVQWINPDTPRRPYTTHDQPPLDATTDLRARLYTGTRHERPLPPPTTTPNTHLLPPGAHHYGGRRPQPRDIEAANTQIPAEVLHEFRTANDSYIRGVKQPLTDLILRHATGDGRIPGEVMSAAVGRDLGFAGRIIRAHRAVGDAASLDPERKRALKAAYDASGTGRMREFFDLLNRPDNRAISNAALGNIFGTIENQAAKLRAAAAAFEEGLTGAADLQRAYFRRDYFPAELADALTRHRADNVSYARVAAALSLTPRAIESLFRGLRAPQQHPDGTRKYPWQKTRVLSVAEIARLRTALRDRGQDVLEIVDQYRRAGVSAARIADALGIANTVVHGWYRALASAGYDRHGRLLAIIDSRPGKIRPRHPVLESYDGDGEATVAHLLPELAAQFGDELGPAGGAAPTAPTDVFDPFGDAHIDDDYRDFLLAHIGDDPLIQEPGTETGHDVGVDAVSEVDSDTAIDLDALDQTPPWQIAAQYPAGYEIETVGSTTVDAAGLDNSLPLDVVDRVTALARTSDWDGLIDQIHRLPAGVTIADVAAWTGLEEDFLHRLTTADTYVGMVRTGTAAPRALADALRLLTEPGLSAERRQQYDTGLRNAATGYREAVHTYLHTAGAQAAAAPETAAARALWDHFTTASPTVDLTTVAILYDQLHHQLQQLARPSGPQNPLPSLHALLTGGDRPATEHLPPGTRYRLGRARITSEEARQRIPAGLLADLFDADREYALGNKEPLEDLIVEHTIQAEVPVAAAVISAALHRNADFASSIVRKHVAQGKAESLDATGREALKAAYANAGNGRMADFFGLLNTPDNARKNSATLAHVMGTSAVVVGHLRTASTAFQHGYDGAAELQRAHFRREYFPDDFADVLHRQRSELVSFAQMGGVLSVSFDAIRGWLVNDRQRQWPDRTRRYPWQRSRPLSLAEVTGLRAAFRNPVDNPLKLVEQLRRAGVTSETISAALGTEDSTVTRWYAQIKAAGKRGRYPQPGDFRIGGARIRHPELERYFGAGAPTVENLLPELAGLAGAVVPQADDAAAEDSFESGMDIDALDQEPPWQIADRYTPGDDFDMTGAAVADDDTEPLPLDLVDNLTALARTSDWDGLVDQIHLLPGTITLADVAAWTGLEEDFLHQLTGTDVYVGMARIDTDATPAALADAWAMVDAHASDSVAAQRIHAHLRAAVQHHHAAVTRQLRAVDDLLGDARHGSGTPAGIQSAERVRQARLTAREVWNAFSRTAAASTADLKSLAATYDQAHAAMDTLVTELTEYDESRNASVENPLPRVDYLISGNIESPVVEVRRASTLLSDLSISQSVNADLHALAATKTVQAHTLKDDLKRLARQSFAQDVDAKLTIALAQAKVRRSIAELDSARSRYKRPAGPSRSQAREQLVEAVGDFSVAAETVARVMQRLITDAAVKAVVAGQMTKVRERVGVGMQYVGLALDIAANATAFSGFATAPAAAALIGSASVQAALKAWEKWQRSDYLRRHSTGEALVRMDENPDLIAGRLIESYKQGVDLLLRVAGAAGGSLWPAWPLIPPAVNAAISAYLDARLAEATEHHRLDGSTAAERLRDYGRDVWAGIGPTIRAKLTDPSFLKTVIEQIAGEPDAWGIAEQLVETVVKHIVDFLVALVPPHPTQRIDGDHLRRLIEGVVDVAAKSERLSVPTTAALSVPEHRPPTVAPMDDAGRRVGEYKRYEAGGALSYVAVQRNDSLVWMRPGYHSGLIAVRAHESAFVPQARWLHRTVGARHYVDPAVGYPVAGTWRKPWEAQNVFVFRRDSDGGEEWAQAFAPTSGVHSDALNMTATFSVHPDWLVPHVFRDEATPLAVDIAPGGGVPANAAGDLREFARFVLQMAGHVARQTLDGGASGVPVRVRVEGGGESGLRRAGAVRDRLIELVRGELNRIRTRRGLPDGAVPDVAAMFAEPTNRLAGPSRAPGERAGGAEATPRRRTFAWVERTDEHGSDGPPAGPELYASVTEDDLQTAPSWLMSALAGRTRPVDNLIVLSDAEKPRALPRGLTDAAQQRTGQTVIYVDRRLGHALTPVLLRDLSVLLAQLGDAGAVPTVVVEGAAPPELSAVLAGAPLIDQIPAGLDIRFVARRSVGDEPVAQGEAAVTAGLLDAAARMARSTPARDRVSEVVGSAAWADDAHQQWLIAHSASSVLRTQAVMNRLAETVARVPQARAPRLLLSQFDFFGTSVVPDYVAADDERRPRVLFREMARRHGEDPGASLGEFASLVEATGAGAAERDRVGLDFTVWVLDQVGLIRQGRFGAVARSYPKSKSAQVKQQMAEAIGEFAAAMDDHQAELREFAAIVLDC